MSKIQKALQQLRDSRHAQAPNRRAKELATNDRTKNGSDSRYDHHDPELADADESLPEFSIEVVPEMLLDLGLQVKGKDIDLLAQQFRRIKRPVLNIAFGAGSEEAENSNVIMVASALPKTGKTFCAFNLATSITREKDFGTVLVDADVVKPNISRALGVENRLGLIDYLSDSATSIDDILVATDLFGMIVVPAGKQHRDATELLASRRMKTLVETLSHRFRARAIIVDTPPLLITNEAHVLAEHMGQIVFVVESGTSTQETVTQALGSLNRNKPINAILNKVRGVSFGGYGGYGGNGGYGDYGNYGQ